MKFDPLQGLYQGEFATTSRLSLLATRQTLAAQTVVELVLVQATQACQLRAGKYRRALALPGRKRNRADLLSPGRRAIRDDE